MNYLLRLSMNLTELYVYHKCIKRIWLLFILIFCFACLILDQVVSFIVSKRIFTHEMAFTEKTSDRGLF